MFGLVSMHSSAAVYLDSKRIGKCFIFFLILSALQLQRRDGRQSQVQEAPPSLDRLRPTGRSHVTALRFASCGSAGFISAISVCLLARLRPAFVFPAFSAATVFTV